MTTVKILAVSSLAVLSALATACNGDATTAMSNSNKNSAAPAAAIAAAPAPARPRDKMADR